MKTAEHNHQLHEIYEDSRLFPPKDDFKRQANVNTTQIYTEAKRNREAFWAKQATSLAWFKPWKQVLEWNPPYAKWFVSGKLNACYNCLDRHLSESGKDKTALIWEGETGEVREYSYDQLFIEVCKFANCLKTLHVKKGDRVALYMPMIPEAVIAMLACARIGAVHTVVFGGFSAESLKDRIQDAQASLLITADGGYRRGTSIHLKEAADKAVSQCPSIKHMVVVKRTAEPIEMAEERDHWYHTLMESASAHCPPEEMDAEDLLYILYTSGTTGKPKGIVHTTGGYMVGVTTTMQWVFDLKPNDIYWCTADIGWVTGHSYVVYGPLSNGATVLIYEGAPDWPNRSRFWNLIEKHKVSIFYTAPTAIRSFMKWGEEWIQTSDLSSLRLLGSVGEPINPEAWLWYHQHIGHAKCPIVDTWWQTETGAIMISALPGITALKPGSACKALPGIEIAILNERGEPSNDGLLAITAPWPAMLRGLYNDPERYEKTYWSQWQGNYYFTSDGAKMDQDAYVWLMGRVDDVINVSGHRIGTMEVESALVDHHQVAEAAVVGIEDPVRGQALAAFVILKENSPPESDLAKRLKQHVVEIIGAIARPEKIIFTPELPKTRSGKIMRRLLRDIAEGRVLGDVTTLADVSVINQLKERYAEE